MAAIENFSVTTFHHVTRPLQIVGAQNRKRETRMRSRFDITILPSWKD
jgi:hypothetical protein